MPLPIESAFQEDAMEMGIPSHEVSRRRVGDDCSALDPPAGGRVVEALDYAVDELADLTVQAAVMAEEDTDHLWKREDHLSGAGHLLSDKGPQRA